MKARISSLARISLFIAALWVAEPGVYAGDRNCDCDGKGSKSTVGSVAVNDAYLNSPRGREEFPWLVRTRSQNETRTARTIAAKQNRALASSPRFREEHPEILRTGGNATVKLSDSIPEAVAKNTALAASPRAREEFPALRITGSGLAGENLCVCLCAVR